ncbi:uncharacterized protein C8Q71DRAFT_412481 [Rhodofomes roseus]|uniref:Cytochrome c oxidase subunit 8, mitochondrial n=1 Tax=Rhodofomes roseus TaxID=34475 RepID=A0ABQ8KPK8_9APHY|nr:uncharacterized protein C8Q71DRAFT_412481 [Rhodofomes roseus]KAH9840548.1 hypothetical protein C8Q71DRAFT_412481 [Rhodofomes roseus]
MSSFSRLSSSNMRLLPLARASRRPAGQVRFAHGEADHAAHGHHGGHAPYHHLPFTYYNKKAFAVKFSVFCLTGFSLPFVAVAWQLHKSGGATVA